MFSIFFTERPIYVDLSINATSKIRIYPFEITDFSKSCIGIILNSAGAFIKDVFLLILQFTLSIKTIILLKKHLSLKKYKVKHVITLNGIYQSASTADSIDYRINRANKNLTIMVAIMGLLTFFEHLSLVAAGCFLTIVLNKYNFCFYNCLYHNFI